MNNLIKTHPSLILNQDIQDICSPLKRLNINYFCHVLVTPDNQFSAIGTSAGFTEHYLKNKYYNVDLHTAKIKNDSSFIVWDMIERCGSTAKMHSEAAFFGVKHTFTLIENDSKGRHCYHFATSGDDLSINQSYLSHLDLLKAFIVYFKETINASKELKKAHQLKFQISSKAKGYQTVSNIYQISDVDRKNYLKMIGNNRVLPSSFDINITLQNKMMNTTVKLTPQQSKCMFLLAAGQTNKQIARTLDLSTRTVENYLYHMRNLLGCHSSKGLIALYHAQNQDEVG